MRMRIKKHRWYPHILKNKDPLIFSIGWRRFQSVPVFVTEDQNERTRMLKYTPKFGVLLRRLLRATVPADDVVHLHPAARRQDIALPDRRERHDRRAESELQSDEETEADRRAVPDIQEHGVRQEDVQLGAGGRKVRRREATNHQRH